jgi:ketosteroid isomerase-like protein
MERTRAFVAGATYLGLSCVLLFAGCDSTAKQPASTRAADEAAVRQTDENWSKAAQSKKVDDWVAFYSDDAVILPPNDKKASTKEEVRKGIGSLLALPGLALSWEPAKVEVAQSGDLAYTQGVGKTSGSKPFEDASLTYQELSKPGVMLSSGTSPLEA